VSSREKHPGLNRKDIGRRYSWIVAGVLCAAMFGCSTSKPPPPAEQNPQFSDEARRERQINDTQVCSNPKVLDVWKARQESTGEFMLGPGDVLQISSTTVNELKDRVVRLDANGNISLPLVGDLKLSGLTEKEAKELIEKKLGDFMYHPQVSVFVQTYHSRQVAVVGAVANPGMFTLSPDDTIGSIIQRAGGMSRDAAQEILFTAAMPESQQRNPATSQGASLSQSGSVQKISAKVPMPGDSGSNGAQQPQGPPAPQETTDYSTQLPILINLVQAGGAGCLGVPLRPGDQIDIPLGGTIKVIGWVNQPKPVQLTPGLTALGAVAAAGGPLFAADLNKVEVIRQGHNQQAQIIKVNLNKVQELQEPDVVLETNDVVQVPYAAYRLPGYAVYYATIAVIQFAPAALIVSGVP